MMRAITFYLSFLLYQGVLAQEVELVIQQGHYMPITSLIFSHNGQYIISGSEDANIKVWHIRSGKEFRALRGHTKEVTKMAISPNGNTLVSGGGRMDESLIFWDWLNGKKLHVIEKAHGNAITAIAYSNNGKLLATGSYRDLKIWDVETKKNVLSIVDFQKYDENPFKHNVESIDFSPDDKVIVTGGYDKFIKFWKVEDGSLISMATVNLYLKDSKAKKTRIRAVISDGRNFQFKFYSDVGDPSRDQNQVNRTFTHNLISDVNVSTFGVFGFG